MSLSSNSINWISSAWEVLMLFLIPIGGGIPAGVLLAKSRGFDWAIMTLLYFISDLILACLFDPVMLLVRRSRFFARFGEAFKKSMRKTVLRDGVKPGPFALIMISFGVDPMTGRTATLAAGHGFVAGWTLAIMGDMLFFALVMASTLWLDKLLGDGTWTAIIITVAMIGIPFLIRRFRKWRYGDNQSKI